MIEEKAKRLIIGIGNRIAGDDGIGPAVIAALARNPPRGVTLVCAEPSDFPILMDGAAIAVIVDASRSGCIPGTVQTFDVANAALPPLRGEVSTHGFSLGEGLALARAIGTLPSACTVIAVEGRAFAPGSAMSSPVNAAIPLAVRLTCAALGADQPGGNGYGGIGDERRA